MYSPMVLYSISPGAFKTLCNQALEYNFIRSGQRNQRGISDYINAMADDPKITYKDTRPQHVIERHEFTISTNRAPLWKSSETRTLHGLCLKPTTIEKFVEVAEQVGILRKGLPYAVGSPTRRKPHQVVGYVLEGLGLGWITPSRYPLGRAYDPAIRPQVPSKDAIHAAIRRRMAGVE